MMKEGLHLDNGEMQIRGGLGVRKLKVRDERMKERDHEVVSITGYGGRRT